MDIVYFYYLWDGSGALSRYLLFYSNKKKMECIKMNRKYLFFREIIMLPAIEIQKKSIKNM